MNVATAQPIPQTAVDAVPGTPRPDRPITKRDLTVGIQSSRDLLHAWGQVVGGLMFDQRHLAGETLQSMSSYSSRDQLILSRVADQTPDTARTERLLERLARQSGDMAKLGAQLLAGPDDSRTADVGDVSQAVYRLAERSTIDTANALSLLHQVRHPEL